ncbi:MAG: hypothetical protein ABI597_06610 [Gammaproteobacteria bacterium]
MKSKRGYLEPIIRPSITSEYPTLQEAQAQIDSIVKNNGRDESDPKIKVSQFPVAKDKYTAYRIDSNQQDKDKTDLVIVYAMGNKGTIAGHYEALKRIFHDFELFHPNNNIHLVSMDYVGRMTQSDNKQEDEFTSYDYSDDGKMLAALIKESSDKYGMKNLLVIGHSYGGNAILFANHFLSQEDPGVHAPKMVCSRTFSSSTNALHEGDKRTTALSIAASNACLVQDITDDDKIPKFMRLGHDLIKSHAALSCEVVQSKLIPDGKSTSPHLTHLSNIDIGISGLSFHLLMKSYYEEKPLKLYQCAYYTPATESMKNILCKRPSH